MLSFMNTRIWLYQNPVDFRKQINGLMVFLSDHLKKDPTSSQLFLFRNSGANKLKLLIWERNGFWLLYKRLEKGRFTFPETNDSHCELTQSQLNWLLSGLDFTKQRVQPAVTARYFH